MPSATIGDSCSDKFSIQYLSRKNSPLFWRILAASFNFGGSYISYRENYLCYKVIVLKKATKTSLHILSVQYSTHFIRCMSAEQTNVHVCSLKSLHVGPTILQLEPWLFIGFCFAQWKPEIFLSYIINVFPIKV